MAIITVLTVTAVRAVTDYNSSRQVPGLKIGATWRHHKMPNKPKPTADMATYEADSVGQYRAWPYTQQTLTHSVTICEASIVYVTLLEFQQSVLR